ncbi:hypothetical protein [Streptomyces atratus]|uniref:hypothetical protein n=1 Tax=Streptomyces atratus TaxID=1893 RepID=UPI002F91497C
MYQKTAEGLETVSPTAPMTVSALIMGLADAARRSVTPAEVSEAPAIPKGATRAQYANVLRDA